jgi:glycine betaine/choline ABC-type transport system substrate-binding protein
VEKRSNLNVLKSLALVLAPLLFASVAAAQSDTPIRVGSKNFTESILVANMIADVLESSGMTVERKLGLGGTGVIHQAIVSGEIDVYPEYTGTALLVQLKLPVESDPDQVYQRVKEEYEQQFNLVWTEPLGFNDTYALAIKREAAQRLGVTSISDLASHSGDLTLGSTQEFLVRPDALPGLESTYGLEFKATRGMDPGLVYQAIDTGGVDVISVFTTDARIKAFDLTVLADDKQFFPPYYLTPVVRKEALEAHPELGGALAKLGGKFTEAEMIEANAAIDIDKRPAAEVSAELLKNKGLIE